MVINVIVINKKDDFCVCIEVQFVNHQGARNVDSCYSSMYICRQQLERVFDVILQGEVQHNWTSCVNIVSSYFTIRCVFVLPASFTLLASPKREQEYHETFHFEKRSQ